jgi:hypothetical protein
VLSPVTGLFCHRHPAEYLPQSLTPASGRQDHTPSPSALALFVKSAAASTAFRPAFVTIAKRPFEEQNARVVKVICPTSEAKYFFEQDWTGSISLIRFNKLAFWRNCPGPYGSARSYWLS